MFKVMCGCYTSECHQIVTFMAYYTFCDRVKCANYILFCTVGMNLVSPIMRSPLINIFYYRYYASSSIQLQPCFQALPPCMHVHDNCTTLDCSRMWPNTCHMCVRAMAGTRLCMQKYAALSPVRPHDRVCP